MTRRATEPAARWPIPSWVRLAALGALLASLAGDPAVPARSTNEPGPGELIALDDRRRLGLVVAARVRESAEHTYRIGVDDLLEVEIPDLREPEPVVVDRPVRLAPEPPSFHRTLRVDRGGLISVPRVGVVRAEGLTVPGLEQVLAAHLRELRVVTTPRPRVHIAEFRSRVVTVAGSVERPGLYPLPSADARVSDVIRAAGGPTPTAGRVIEFSPMPAVPDSGTRPESKPPVPARHTTSAPTRPWLAMEDVRLDPAGAGRRVVLTLTRAPDGIQSFVLDDPPRLVLDLAGPGVMAHGHFTRRALGDTLVASVRTAPHDGRLRAVIDFAGRPVDHTVQANGELLIVSLGAVDIEPAMEPVVAQAAPPEVGPGPATIASVPMPIRLDLDTVLHTHGVEALASDPPVRSGDVIALPAGGSVLIDGWVDHPGPYRVTRGLTVARAVAKAGGTLFPADDGRIIIRRRDMGGAQTYVVDLHRIARGEAQDVPVTDGDVVRVPANRLRLIPWSLWRTVSALF